MESVRLASATRWTNDGVDGCAGRLGRITKMGDRYLRKLLVVGACATLCQITVTPVFTI